MRRAPRAAMRSILMLAPLALATAAPGAALPSPANALTGADVSGVIERAIARARQLGFNATIGVLDSEGNILGVVRMTDPAFGADPGTSTIAGGGTGGLEGVTVPSGVTAATKAGTGAFLSTSVGNAFTTRTAGFIIQEHFPPGIEFRPSGPLFGVQFSSLPTSDINRLPLGLSADPGGVPLYRGGEIVGGVGVELDGAYTVDRTPRIRTIVPEESIARAAQVGFAPPTSITADRITVDGLRLAYQNGGAPGALGAVSLATEVGAGRAVALIAPRAGPTVSKFTPAMVGSVPGQTLRDLTSSRYEAVAVGEGALYGVRAAADLTRNVVRIAVPSGTITPLFTLTGAGANQLPLDDSVSALAYDDNLTPAFTADDRLVVFTGSARVFTVGLTGLGAMPLVALSNPDARPRDAICFNDAGANRVLALSGVTGQAFKISVAAAGTPAGVTPLTTAADGPLQSIGAGVGGLFAIREAPLPAPAGTRDFVRIAPAGGVTLVQRLTDGGANEPAPGQNILALAYDDAGTPGAADDALVAQNSSLARQFRLSPTTGAIGAPAVALPDRRATLTQARIIRASGDPYLVGVSRQSRRVFAVRADAPAPAANTIELTPPDPIGFARAGLGATAGGATERLTEADVTTALTQAHELNIMLRAQIRRDRPQISRVNAAVVDARGNLLGFFRNADAPVFGADVCVQKARTAAFFSRPDAGAALRAAEGGRFTPFADAAAAIGVALDGSLAISDRAGGFLARPTLPDGIPLTSPGPFSVRPPDQFSVFNTGLQTQLLLTNLVAFLTEFASVGDEGLALDLFNSGVIGAGGVAAPSLGIHNGQQIFPGSVPLYKNGVLVGAIGVSGDGIEQDDFVAYTGGRDFRAYGAARTSDRAFVTTAGGRTVRLPYVKLPRNPFAGR